MNIIEKSINFIFHINLYLSQLINTYGSWTYAILFLIIFCETGLVVTPFLPGDSLLFAAGGLFASSNLNVHALIPTLIFAAFCGDNTNYHFGKWLGPKIFKPNALILKMSHLDKTRTFYDKQGKKAVIIARFIPIFRTYVPFVAGIAKMPYTAFISYSFVGACLWVGSLTYMGYLFGNLPIVKNNFSMLILAIIFLSVTPIILKFFKPKISILSQKNTVIKLSIRTQSLLLMLLPILIITGVLGAYCIKIKMEDINQTLKFQSTQVISRLLPPVQYALSTQNMTLLKTMMTHADNIMPIISTTAIYHANGQLLAKHGKPILIQKTLFTHLRESGAFRTYTIQKPHDIIFITPIAELSKLSMMTHQSLNTRRLYAAQHLLGWLVIKTNTSSHLLPRYSALFIICFIALLGLILAVLFGLKIGAEMEAQTQKLKKAQFEARESARIKAEFLANMSHEIRTPLNAIIGFAELLLETTLNKTQQEHIGTVSQSAGNLLQIINDVLDFSKSEAGKLKLRPQVMNISTCAKQVITLLQAQATEKSLTLSLDIAHTTPEWIIADDLRLKQILTNLVGNAIKFTHEGSICVQITPDQQHSRKITINIIDTGIGIDTHTQSKLFNAFTQGDASTTRQYGGTGLGLIISQKLVSQMNGSITLNSTPGKGSTFGFTFEYNRPTQTDIQAVQTTPNKNIEGTRIQQNSKLKQFNILAVDDNPANLKLIKIMLKKIGLSTFTAESGFQALEVVHTHTIHLILMDLQMPKMDGIQTTLKIREIRGYQHTPIIALTADILDNQKKAIIKSGMNGYQTKPIAIHDLKALLVKFLNIKIGEDRLCEESLIDLDAGARLVDGDKTLAQEMLDLQISQLPEYIQKIQSNFESNNTETLLQSVHKLHGGLCYVGLPKLKDAAAQCERSLKENDREEIPHRVHTLLNLMKKVISGSGDIS